MIRRHANNNLHWQWLDPLTSHLNGKISYRITSVWTISMKEYRTTTFILVHQAWILEMRNKSSFSLNPSICKICYFFTIELLPLFSIEHLQKTCSASVSFIISYIWRGIHFIPMKYKNYYHLTRAKKIPYGMEWSVEDQSCWWMHSPHCICSVKSCFKSDLELKS